VRTCYWPRAVIDVTLHGRADDPGMVVRDAFGGVGADIVRTQPGHALLDVTHWQREQGAPESMAQRMAAVLGERFPDRTWSMGVAGDRWVAAMAAAMAGPGGVNVIPPWDVSEWLRDVPLDLLHGCDREMRRFLLLLGVRTCGELASLPAATFIRRYGATGKRLWLLCRGRDPAAAVQEVLPVAFIDQERVLPPRTSAPRTVTRYLGHMCQRLAARLCHLNLHASQLRVELRFGLPTGGVCAVDAPAAQCRMPAVVGVFSLPAASADGARLFGYVQDLLACSWHGQPLTSARVVAMELRNMGGQLELFAPPPMPHHMSDDHVAVHEGASPCMAASRNCDQ